MIGGNITAYLEVRTTKKNEIGEAITKWETKYQLVGFLDLSTGDSKHTNFNAKLQESTHIFICDYLNLEVKANQARMVINKKSYDVQLIDNPMELNEHIEIYLKYIGD